METQLTSSQVLISQEVTSPIVATADASELHGEVQLNGQGLPWSVWDGQQLRRYFAIDCETTLIVGHAVPKLAMVSVSDGRHHYVVRPDQVPQLLLQHLPYKHHLIAHNVAFDFGCWIGISTRLKPRLPEIGSGRPWKKVVFTTA